MNCSFYQATLCLVAGARPLKICAMSAVNQDVRCLWSVWVSCWHIGRLKVWRPEKSTVSPKIEESKTKWKESVDRIQFSIISCQFFWGDFFLETSERPR